MKDFRDLPRFKKLIKIFKKNIDDITQDEKQFIRETNSKEWSEWLAEYNNSNQKDKDDSIGFCREQHMINLLRSIINDGIDVDRNEFVSNLTILSLYDSYKQSNTRANSILETLDECEKSLHQFIKIFGSTS